MSSDLAHLIKSNIYFIINKNSPQWTCYAMYLFRVVFLLHPKETISMTYSVDNSDPSFWIKLTLPTENTLTVFFSCLKFELLDIFTFFQKSKQPTSVSVSGDCFHMLHNYGIFPCGRCQFLILGLVPRLERGPVRTMCFRRSPNTPTLRHRP